MRGQIKRRFHIIPVVSYDDRNRATLGHIIGVPADGTRVVVQRSRGRAR